MGNLLILAPAPIAAIAVSRGSGAMNLLTPDPKEVWADTVAGLVAQIDIDFGAVRSIDSVFLGHVLPPHADAVWTITGGTAGYTQLAVKASGPLRVADVVNRAPSLSHAFWHGQAVSLRYLRLSLTQKAGEPPLTAGVVLAGLGFVPAWNREWGSGRRVIDTGTATALADGGFSIVEGARKAAWSWTMGDLSNAEIDWLWEIVLARGETLPLLVIEDPDATAGLRRRMHYGKFQQLRPFERSKPNRNRWELTIEDWGGDEAAPL
ncbi:MAG: hypothetical protein V4808_07265 [Pseudomonadota bacterium]